MATLSERHSLWLLAALVAGQLILLAAQVADPSGRGSRLEAWTLRLVAPVAGAVAGAGDSLSRLTDAVATNVALRRANRRLATRVADLQRELADLHGVEGELERLAEAVGYARASRVPLVVADIVYYDPRSWLRSLVLRTEEGDVHRDQPVVTERGLVGRVVLVSGPYAKVQILSDRSAAVGAMIERTRRQGMLRGGEAGGLRLDFVPQQEDVRPGDRVITAGIDGIYPRGIPVGTVRSVEPGVELFHRILVEPAVDLRRLDHAYVLQLDAIPEELLRISPDATP